MGEKMNLDANRNVLIVDDSKLMRMMLKQIVEELNMFDLIEEAENGKIALEKLDNAKFEIILLDIEMPIMNGVEALREIRLRHKAKVIIVSSLAQIGSTYSAEVKKLGADGIIDKPGGALDPTLAQKKGEDLKHLINQLVKN
tara:strand:- start:11 stop:436 length:426 start_codon:yes stop_codon:yes gene_type:complete